MIWSLSLGATSSSMMVFPLLKWTSMPYLLHMFLNASLSPSLYGTEMELLHVGLLLWLLFLLCLGALILVFILFIAHIGYLQSDKASCICFCSCFNNSWLEHMFLALCSNELITLYLFDMAWWLSHFRYKLVWVGFLYTLVCRLPSCFGVIKLSKKGMDPSSLVSSTVNLMWLSTVFMWWKNSSLYLFPGWQRCHPHIFSTDLGGVEL